MDFGTGRTSAEDPWPKSKRKRPRKLAIIGTLDHAFHSVGGRETAIEMARLGSYRDEQLKELVRNWDSMSYKEHQEPQLLEKLSLAVGLHPAEFFGRVATIAYKYNFDMAQLTAALKVKDIIEKRAEYAMEKDGYRDAELVMRAGGILQQGPLVQVTQTQTTQTLNVSAGLPPVEELSGKVSNLIRPALTSPALPPASDLGFAVSEPEKEKIIDVEPLT